MTSQTVLPSTVRFYNAAGDAASIAITPRAEAVQVRLQIGAEVLFNHKVALAVGDVRKAVASVVANGFDFLWSQGYRSAEAASLVDATGNTVTVVVEYGSVVSQLRVRLNQSAFAVNVTVPTPSVPTLLARYRDEYAARGFAPAREGGGRG